MQPLPRQPASQPPVKIYNAVYSSVQVYECMIRGIAVMRRRGDSYVNATQILKVAGVDKGRRTKILEKEILPGKHEIVQGGYGKYQGTWIPLERGRDIASQYGVAALLAPLFDFTPSTSSLAALPVSTPNISASPRPLSASSSYGSMGGGPGGSQYMGSMPSTLAPPPIMPGSALRLLNQGRAQGLFTPSTSGLAVNKGGYNSPTGSGYLNYSGSFSSASQTPPPSQPTLKRTRSDADVEAQPTSGVADVSMADYSRPMSAGPPPPSYNNGAGPSGTTPEERPPPAKRPRNDPEPAPQHNKASPAPPRPAQTQSSSTPKPPTPKSPPLTAEQNRTLRLASKPSIPRNLDPTIPLKDTRRAAVIAAICQGDDPNPVVNLLREITSVSIQGNQPTQQPPPFDIDTILDDHGHTALHISASLSRLVTVQALIQMGADVHRGNHLGETPLMRTILSTHSYDGQTLPSLLSAGLARSIMTLDTSKKSVLHHVVLLAGVKGRSIIAKYYLDQVFTWIAKENGGDFSKIIDLQDEHGDTALNVAARVGSRILVRTLVDIGANKALNNKLGLRPGDFGVETEELNTGLKGEDIIAMLRAVPPVPVQKSQDVIADMTSMIQGLSTDFQSEIKSKQDALDVTQAHLRAATRELSEQRKQIQAWQGRVAELDIMTQRVKNVEKAIREEDSFDWTGRWKSDEQEDASAMDVDKALTPEKEKANGEANPAAKENGMDGVQATSDKAAADEEDADASGDDDEEAPAPPRNIYTGPKNMTNLKFSAAFRYRGTIAAMTALPPGAEAEPPIPTTNDVATLIRLRRMKMWQARTEELMAERLKGLQGASTEKEYMCKKIVSLCTGTQMDKVEEMLESLVVAVESEPSVVDIGRVSGFMQKVRDGII